MTKSNWEPTSRAKHWRTLYTASDAADRILNTREISLEARDLLASKSKDEVLTELRYATGDRSTATKVCRIAELPESLITKAVKHVRQLDKKRTKAAAVPPDQRGTRAAEPERVRRSTGFSRTHLLFLASVEDVKTRDQLFRDSLKNDWSLEELKRQVKAARTGTALRPLSLAYATSKRASDLMVYLDKLATIDVPSAARVVKPGDRKSATEECTKAARELEKLERRIGSAVTILRAIRDELNKLN